MAPMASGIALAAQALSVRVQRRTLLHDVALQLPAGRWTSIVGPNGAGKSTLLRALVGLQPLAQGQVWLQGRPLADWPRRERAQCLAWLGQGEGAADDLCVYDVAMLGRLPHQGWMQPPSSADHAAVEQALRTTQAWDWRGRALGQLSGGERQRVLLARALAVQAPITCMDEPLANLDPPHQSDWLRTVRALVASGRTVVSVLHEISIALQADELLILDQGQIRHHGPCSAPATHAALEAVFEQRVAVRQIDGLWMALPRV